MAGSRLDRIGTIFSRASGLIKAGAIPYEARPVWYDVYRVFPPKYEPHIDREPEKKEVMDILYKEDKFRALYFKKFGLNPGGTARKINDRNFEEPSQTFINTCLELMKTRPDFNDEQLFNAAVESEKIRFSSRRSTKSAEPEERELDIDIIKEGEASKRHGRTPPTITVQSLRSLFEEAKEKQQKSETEMMQQKKEEDKIEDEDVKDKK